MRGTVAAVSIRPFRDGDESQVLDLLRVSLGGRPAGTRAPDLFRWKHLENPFGRSMLFVGEASGRIIGLRAFMWWRFEAGDQTITAVRAVDTATHPDFRGRGVFSELTRAALDEARANADMVFNTPNEKSLPGYLKMGWVPVGRVPIAVRLRRPIAFLRTFRGGRPASARAPVGGLEAGEILSDSEGVSELLRRMQQPGPRLATPRSLEYLRWRYASAPVLDYRGVALRGPRGIDGLVFFRVRPRGGSWETTVSDVLVPSGNVSGAARLLRLVAMASRTDHLTCSFPRGSAASRASRRAGYLRAPGGMTLVTNPLRAGITPNPTELRSWALSLGDLEVF
jgi:GNAT superfamily N-acetyltransferase